MPKKMIYRGENKLIGQHTAKIIVILMLCLTLLPIVSADIYKWVNMTDGFPTETVAVYSITKNNTNFWAGRLGSVVWEYNSSGDFLQSVNVGGANGITTNGTHFWTITNNVGIPGTCSLEVWNSTLDQIGATIDLNETAGIMECEGITTNGTDFWVIDIHTSWVHHLNSTFNNITTGFNVSSSGCGEGYGITTNNSDFWIIDATDDFIYHFNSTGDNQTDGMLMKNILAPNPSIVGIDTNFTTRMDGGVPSNFWLSDNDIGHIYHIKRETIITENTHTFNTSAYETAIESYVINITYNSSAWTSITGILYYNGTGYTTTRTRTGNEAIFTKTIDIPTGIGNKTFFWNIGLINLTGTSYYNLTEKQQEVNLTTLISCNTTYTTRSLNFTAGIEKNLTILKNWNYEGTYTYWLGSGSTFKNYSSVNTSTDDHHICIYPNRTLKTIAQITYGKTGYTTRDYYFYEKNVTNVSQDIKLLLLSTSDTTSFIVRVIDEDQLAVVGAYVYVYRYDVGTGTYNIAEVSVTDANGATISHFEEDVADYKIIITLNGATVFVGEKQKIFCEETPCSVTFQLTGDALTTWGDFGDLSQLTHSLTFDATTNIWNYTYVDASGVIDWGRLYVYNLTGDSKNTICNITSTSSAATLLCDVSNHTGQTYAASYISRSPEVLLSLKSAIIAGFKEIFGTEGLFLSMFVLLVLALAGLWNPAVGIVLVVAGMIMLSMLGFATFGAVSIWAIIFIAGIILWELKT